MVIKSARIAQRTNTTMMIRGMYGAPLKLASIVGRMLDLTGFIAAFSKLLSIGY